METEIDSNSNLPENEPPSAQKKRKKWIALIIILFIFIVSVIAGYFYLEKQKEKQAEKQRQAFAESFIGVITTMTTDGAIAEDIVNQYRDVWQSAIYDERYVVDGQTYELEWNEDFNDALAKLHNSFESDGTINNLEDSVSSIESKVKALIKPSQDYEDAYDTLIELYKTYKSYTGLALNPSGSLQTYSEDASDLSNEFVEQLNEILVRIPDDEASKKAKEEANF